MEDIIEKIKERIDIVDLISDYVPLKRVGSNYRALCPFHPEKTPSFFVSPSLQIFKCFGCGKGGDIFKFIMEIERVSFREALEILAKRAGVELEKEPPQKREERQKILDIYDITCAYFQKQLFQSQKGKEVLNYLKKRGLRKETIYKWKIGFAPRVKDFLYKFLISRGFQREDLKKTGIIKEKGGRVFDFFFLRIIFPIFDLHGNVVAFAGRVLPGIEEEGGKYINSPNHLLYNKSKILYGLNFAKEEIKSKKEAILVEGYFDVLLSWQEGTKNVVAPCGTSFGDSHMRLLKRFTQNLIFSFDMDDAGIKAAKRSTILAQKEGFKVKVLPLPSGKDPADVIKGSKNEWEKALSERKEGVLFFYELSLKKWDKKAFSGKREILNFFLPILSSIKDKIEIQEWIQKISFDLKIKEEILWEEVNEFKKEIEKEKKVFERYDEKKEIFAKAFSQKDLIEERLLCIVAFEKDLREKFKDSLLKLISHPERKKIIISILEKGKIPEEFSQKAKEMKFQYEIEKENGIDFEKEVPFLLERLKKIYIKGKLEKFQEELKEAEAKKDFSQVKKILSQIENAKKEI